MIVREVDVDGDWGFGRGRANFKSGNDAVAQNISTRLKSVLGDCFFDLEAGIDWFNLLGSKNRLGLELSERTTILGTANVTGILELTNTLDENRTQNISFSVNTVFSQSPVSTTVGVQI